MRYSILVKPGSAREEVRIAENNNLIVFTHARAHENEANKSVIKLLARHFNVAKNQIRVVQGLRSRYKVIDVIE